MVERPEPFIYPSRNHFPFDLAVPNRQLWAIGMIVAQWSMTEMIVDQHICQMIGDDLPLQEQLKRVRNAQEKIAFWKTTIELRLADPARARALELVSRVQQLNSQRDEVVHRAWGGGMEASSWSGGGAEETTEAALLRKTGDKYKTKSGDARATLHWRLTFNRMRQMAVEMAILNRDLLLPQA
jgi:hypothetical protein